MPKKRMMINFDLDTKKYEKITNKPSPTAYYQIRQYMEKNEYVHRQGSCYISKQATSRAEVLADVKHFSLNNKWFNHCVKELDLTTVGRTLSIKLETQTKDNILENVEQNNSKDFDISENSKDNKQNEFEMNVEDGQTSNIEEDLNIKKE